MLIDLLLFGTKFIENIEIMDHHLLSRLFGKGYLEAGQLSRLSNRAAVTCENWLPAR
jgi:hypothetical protein